eukprot:3549847-Prymnesium_polylepis.1
MADVLGVVTIRVHIWRGLRVEAKTETAFGWMAKRRVWRRRRRCVARVWQRVQKLAGMGPAF